MAIFDFCVPIIIGLLLRSVGAHGDGRRSCGTPVMTLEEQVKDANDFQAWMTMKASLQADGTAGAAAANVLAVDWSTPGTVITIPTYVHVIHNGTLGEQFTYASNPSYIQNQIKVLNVGFRGEEGMYLPNPNGRSYDRYSVSNADTKIQFCLAGTTATDKASWYSMIEDSAEEERSMKTVLKIGGMETLNVYVASPTSLFGWVPYYPSEIKNQKEAVLDGVVILNDSMPGGIASPFNEGDTLTHEVGHWLNLAHTFDRGCKGLGDYMDLAPPSADYMSKAAKEKEAHFECPVNLDDCTNDWGKKTPIHSFMSYVDVSLQFMTLHERNFPFLPALSVSCYHTFLPTCLLIDDHY